MPIFRLPQDLIFPAPGLAEPNGLLAIGGDLSPQRLLLAYQQGIFPWFSDGEPLLWWSPDPRTILVPSELHLPKSLTKTLRQKRFVVTKDRAFAAVIAGCATPHENDGTWITDSMREAYKELHRLGYAHSVEAWVEQNGINRLVGGLYGVALGGCFFGESMFYTVPDASKVALATLVPWLRRRNFTLIDCQMQTSHLQRFGARNVPRTLFLHILDQALTGGLPQGSWSELPWD